MKYDIILTPPLPLPYTGGECLRIGCFSGYDIILTPPLPLPYKGGELLPPTYPRFLRSASPSSGGGGRPFPSLVGEGQGWGH